MENEQTEFHVSDEPATPAAPEKETCLNHAWAIEQTGVRCMKCGEFRATE